MATPQIEKVITKLEPLDRWLAKFVALINAWWKLGTDKIQAVFVPAPTDANDLQVLQYNASTNQFQYAAAGGIPKTVTRVTATAPIHSTGGTTPVISHDASGVTPGTYGDATHAAQMTVDATGHVSAASSVAIPLPSFSDAEVPSGSITGTNGSDGNASFAIAHAPLGEPLVVVTGVVKQLGVDYVRVGALITFLAPQIPIAGNDWIRIWSRY
jgi:hypothetical protein